jgi:hypothetical protein
VSRSFTPHPYQTLARDFMLETPRCALFAGMGMGKSVTALTVADIELVAGNGYPTLVLGPLRVARDVWTNEARKWDHLKHLRISAITGTLTERRRALHREADIYTINYECLPWLCKELGKGVWPFPNVIADESTRLKGHRCNSGGQRAKALADRARQTLTWRALTGTPAPNGLKDLWGQFWFVDFGERLGRTYTAFMERWFHKGFDGHTIEPYPHAEKEIHERIADITLSICPEDWFDLQKPIENVVRVQLPTTAKKHYKELERDMFTEFACGTELEVFNSAALTNKCLQFANGAVYTKAPEWKAVHDAKLEALESVVNEAAGDSLLVAYAFVSDKARILGKFKDAVDISTKDGMKAFRAGHKRIGVAHPASMGHGIDGLQDVTNRLVYFGHDWNLELRQQILERIGPMRQKQSGHNRPVWVTSIVADETLDDDVLERHESKRKVQDVLMDAMNRRG